MTTVTINPICESALASICAAWRAGDIRKAWHEIDAATGARWPRDMATALLPAPLPGTESAAVAAATAELESAAAYRKRIDEARARLEERFEDDQAARPEAILAAFSTTDSRLEWFTGAIANTAQPPSVTARTRVALLGEFSSGKSRLINALLGRKVLSIGMVPVTRSVTRVVYGEAEEAEIRFVSGDRKVVPLADLRTWTDERKHDERQQNGQAEPIDRVEVRLPIAILRQVELWDTPGFNAGNELHDATALQLLQEADAVLWVLSPHMIGAGTEIRALKVASRAQGKLLAVLNKCDTVPADKLDGVLAGARRIRWSPASSCGAIVTVEKNTVYLKRWLTYERKFVAGRKAWACLRRLLPITTRGHLVACWYSQHFGLLHPSSP